MIIHAFTKVLVIEIAPHKIWVNCIIPVATDKTMFPYFFNDLGVKDGKYEESVEHFVAGIHMGRLSVAEDIAKAAVFLVSDDLKFMTGVVLYVDEGQSI